MEDRRKGRRITKFADLDESLILYWADAHFRRHGVWPNNRSGPVDGRPGETWSNVNKALNNGHRGLPGGSSLSKLLEAQRGVPRHADLPSLTVDKILEWADLHLDRHQRYPIATDGKVDDNPRETWAKIDSALNKGYRGLPGGITLSKLLHEHRGKFRQSELPKLTEEQILGWMDEHFARTGEWPTLNSGAIHASPSDNWRTIEGDLYKGLRGLPGKTSLARLAIVHRGRPDLSVSTPLTRDLISEWMIAFTERHGAYPSRDSGPVEDAEGEHWASLNTALEKGYRSLPGRQTLAGLREELISEKRLPDLPRRRPVKRESDILTNAKIADLMQQFATIHGQYPKRISGPVAGLPDDTWATIEDALINGRRGLPGGQNLPMVRRELIAQGRLPVSAYDFKRGEPISKEQIAGWKKAYAGKSRRPGAKG
jgi:hypothetical protein